jgi:hypothetical protein
MAADQGRECCLLVVDREPFHQLVVRRSRDEVCDG